MSIDSYCYTFIFTESSDSTNVQFNELECLIRMIYPQIVNIKTVPLLTLFKGQKLKPNTILQTKFKQSSIIKTTFNEELLGNIAKRASYLHSCGPLINAFQMDTASVETVREDISNFIRQRNISKFELSFYTRDQFGQRADALEGLLIDEKRFFLRELPFEHARNRLESWDGPGKIVLDSALEKDARIWIYKDVNEGFGETSIWNYPEKEDEIFLIIYNPKFRVKNALFDLDNAAEAKPYWKGIDTTPERLMSAMLNLAQIQTGQVILEPFAHTGTLIHEAVKYDLEKIIYNDKFETIGAKDNLELLTSHPEEIIKLVHEIRSRMMLKNGSSQLPSYANIRELVQSSLKWEADEAYPKITGIDVLQKKNSWLDQRECRLLFYIIRRFYIENRIGCIRNNTSKKSKTYGKFRDMLEGNELIALNEFTSNALNQIQIYAEKISRIGTERVSKGIVDIGYSPIAQDKCQFLVPDSNIDISKYGIPLEENSIDAIITDPPYGYGSLEDQKKIMVLYKKFFEEAYKVLKPCGRIVMCVLDKVRTGKEILPEVMTEGVVELANNVAKSRNISFLTNNLRPYGRDELLLSYWKAKHKLNRGILAFQIFKVDHD